MCQQYINPDLYDLFDLFLFIILSYYLKDKINPQYINIELYKLLDLVLFLIFISFFKTTCRNLYIISIISLTQLCGECDKIIYSLKSCPICFYKGYCKKCYNMHIYLCQKKRKLAYKIYINNINKDCQNIIIRYLNI